MKAFHTTEGLPTQARLILLTCGSSRQPWFSGCQRPHQSGHWARPGTYFTPGTPASSSMRLICSRRSSDKDLAGGRGGPMGSPSISRMALSK